MKREEVIVNFENSIGPWLGKTVKVIEYHLQELFNSHNLDLTKEQMIVLKMLNADDGLSQNELAFLTLRNKSSLTRLLSKMEKKEYILRKRSKEDKRINHIHLTEKGKSTFKRAQPVLKQIIEKIEDGISASEKKKMISSLKKIQSNFGEKSKSL